MSKPKKGVSADEKRVRMLGIFHESADVFTLPDIEKGSIKRGIIAQAVKDVLQTLIDDDLVHKEKIGASNFYWSFPSEASVKLDNEHAKLSADVAALDKRKAEMEGTLQAQRAAKPDTAARANALAALDALRQQVAQNAKELEQYKDNDPATIHAMRIAVDVAHAAANRWLDNNFALLSYCRKKFPNSQAELAKLFQENGLTEDLENTVGKLQKQC